MLTTKDVHVLYEDFTDFRKGRQDEYTFRTYVTFSILNPLSTINGVDSIIIPPTLCKLFEESIQFMVYPIGQIMVGTVYGKVFDIIVIIGEDKTNNNFIKLNYNKNKQREFKILSLDENENFEYIDKIHIHDRIFMLIK